MKKEFGSMSIYFCGAALGAGLAAQDDKIMGSQIYIAILLIILYIFSGMVVAFLVAHIGNLVDEKFFDNSENEGKKRNPIVTILAIAIWSFIVLLISSQVGKA